MSNAPSGGRETAQRLFAAEFADATHEYAESDDDRAPNYVVAPSGLRMNRVFVAGVLTEISPAGDSMVRARIADPTGAFVCYAGQYQPEALATLESLSPPAFVAITGKARTFSPDDADVVYSSIRPEAITEIDAETRDRWSVRTARRTLERVATTDAVQTRALEDNEIVLTRQLEKAGVPADRAAGIARAQSAYGTTTAYLSELQRLSIDVLELVAGQKESVDPLSYPPGEDATVSFVPAIDQSIDLDENSSPEPQTNPEHSDAPSVTDSTERPDAHSGETALQSDPDTESSDESITSEPDVTDETAAAKIDTAVDESFEDDSPIDDGASASDTADDSVTEPTQDDELSADPDEFDPEEFELDEEVREQVESEFGTEFSTASEVDTSDMEESPDDGPDQTPAEGSVEADLEESADSSMVEDDEQSEITDAGERDTENGQTDSERAVESDAESIDISSVVLNEMRSLNDGDGVDRTELIDAVTARADVTVDDVSDAIQDALMNGQCYEPAEDTLKPI
ncbi:hypothetical protein [Halocatena halophila]|uniref:hypothetical protein n=1 Tax=Halocatena halophila TaxID=2814576 RepID=UPI002ED1D51A